MNALLMKTSDDVMFAWMCAMFCMCVSYNRYGDSFIQSFIDDGRNAETSLFIIQ